MKLTPDRLEQILVGVRPELGADVTVRAADLGAGRCIVEVTVGGNRLSPINVAHYEERDLSK